MRRDTRVGLVLGAGGVLGGAWLVGALHALRSELRWEPRNAAHLVGTSAGATMAALLAAGVGADDLLPEAARTMKDTRDVQPETDWLLLELAAEANYRLAGQVPRPIPGSLGLCLAGLRQPGFWTPFRLLSGLAPRGHISTDPIKRTIRRAQKHLKQDGWPVGRTCWLVATDYLTGRRTVFGREDAPAAELADAAAASCAIPGFFEPQRIDGRLYVDGGLGSLSHLDLLAGAGLDLAICLNPMSSREGSAGWSPLEQVSRAFSRAAAWQLRREAERVRRFGTPIVLLEPCAEDLALMGGNMMDAKKAIEVAQLASESVAAQLRSLLDGKRLSEATIRTVRELPTAA